MHIACVWHVRGVRSGAMRRCCSKGKCRLMRLTGLRNFVWFLLAGLFFDFIAALLLDSTLYGSSGILREIAVGGYVLLVGGEL